MGTIYDGFIGLKFNRLTVISIDLNTKYQNYLVCKCDCGKITTASKQYILTGKKKSCGCLNSELAHKRLFKHGQTGKTKEYSCWIKMASRCFNSNDKSFKYYGGRGIGVCKRWKDSFVAFFNDMGEKPSPKHSIDRINVNGDYEPSNCRWATEKEQKRNKTTTVYITINGQSKCVSEWAEILKVNPKYIYQRLKRGWNETDAVFKPLIRTRGEMTVTNIQKLKSVKLKPIK